MTTTKTTISINGTTVSGDIATIRAILGLSDMGETVATETLKATKGTKGTKATKGTATKAKATKGTKGKGEPVYSKGGAIIQVNDQIAAKGKQKSAITKAYNALTAQGFTVERKRCGSWVYIYQVGDSKRPAKQFAAVKLDAGWKLIKGAWVYPHLLKDYEDCFVPQK